MGSDLSGPHVLVVDDDPVSLLLLRHILESNGCTVVEATGVSEACAMLLTHDGRPIEIIISDYLMEDGTGLDLFGAVAEEERYSATPFVLLTGMATMDELDDRRVDAVDAFVTKPVSTQELLSVIDGFVPPGIAAA